MRGEVRWGRMSRAVVDARDVSVGTIPLDISLAARPGEQVGTVEDPNAVALPVLLATAVVVRRSVGPRCLATIDAVVGCRGDPYRVTLSRLAPDFSVRTWEIQREKSHKHEKVTVDHSMRIWEIQREKSHKHEKVTQSPYTVCRGHSRQTPRRSQNQWTAICCAPHSRSRARGCVCTSGCGTLETTALRGPSSTRTGIPTLFGRAALRRRTPSSTSSGPAATRTECPRTSLRRSYPGSATEATMARAVARAPKAKAPAESVRGVGCAMRQPTAQGAGERGSRGAGRLRGTAPSSSHRRSIPCCRSATATRRSRPRSSTRARSGRARHPLASGRSVARMAGRTDCTGGSGTPFGVGPSYDRLVRQS
eukprot:SAG31_NODE_2921_length_4909_cov_2.815385_4_plen_365_part_00